jgi:hypothetical protein
MWAIDLNDEINRKMANVWVVLILFFMILCEAAAIHGLWFGKAIHVYALRRYSLPVLIAFPALFLPAIRRQARRWVAQEQITSDLAARIVQMFCAATMVSYVCILWLAELAFLAR